MRQTRIRSVAVLACAMLAWQPSGAIAQDEDVQLWVYATAQAELDADWRLTVDATARWREQARGDEQQTLRFTVVRALGQGVRLGGGAGIFETEGGSTELRPHQQISFRSGRFSTRTRFEQRFFEGADRVELRLRQLARFALPISERFDASIDGEYLGLLQTRNRGSSAPSDQWRARAIISSDLSERLTLGAGYLLILTPREGATTRINHIPQLYLTTRF